MKKSTKGAAAAGVAAVLLLGGAGSLAYWTANESVPGTTLSSGSLSITNDTCGTAKWLLDDGTTDASTAEIVPGDTITKTCEFEIDGVGDHLKNVTLTIGAPNWNATSDSELTSALGTVDAAYSDGTAPVVSGGTVDVGKTITATFTMTFATSSDNTTETKTATLDDITITATQNHSAS